MKYEHSTFGIHTFFSCHIFILFVWQQNNIINSSQENNVVMAGIDDIILLSTLTHVQAVKEISFSGETTHMDILQLSIETFIFLQSSEEDKAGEQVSRSLLKILNRFRAAVYFMECSIKRSIYNWSSSRLRINI